MTGPDAFGERFGRAATGAILLAALAVVAGLAVGPASAGDNPAMFYFEPGEVEADAGETVTVDVVLQTTGGYEGEGVVRSAVGVEYDPDVLTAVEIERGPFLEGDDGATVNATTEIDDERGLATIEQERDAEGDEDGADGTKTLATLTFEVADDADPTNAALTMTDVSAVLATDHHQQTMTRDGTILVEGGVEEADDSSDADGVILADDADADDTDDDDDSSAGAEAVPGFGPLAAIAALGAAVLAGLQRAVRRD